jgi:hypothetical protein
MMALENHWGPTTSVDTLLVIHKVVGSSWLGINLDTGNYPGDPIAARSPTLVELEQPARWAGKEPIC